MNISISKLIEKVDKTPKINDDDALVRELLEICYQNSNYGKIENLSKFNSRIFIRAYKEIFKTDMEDMQLIKDMIHSEYLVENLHSSNPYIDNEDEIY